MWLEAASPNAVLSSAINLKPPLLPASEIHHISQPCTFSLLPAPSTQCRAPKVLQLKCSQREAAMLPIVAMGIRVTKS